MFIAQKFAYLADYLSTTSTNRGLKRGNILFCFSRFIGSVCLARVAARFAGRLRSSCIRPGERDTDDEMTVGTVARETDAFSAPARLRPGHRTRARFNVIGVIRQSGEL